VKAAKRRMVDGGQPLLHGDLRQHPAALLGLPAGQHRRKDLLLGVQQPHPGG
jgi:hypothetical protein